MCGPDLVVSSEGQLDIIHTALFLTVLHEIEAPLSIMGRRQSELGK